MRVVIVGGGFAGVKTALELAKDQHMQITLISDKDYFLYYPALYGTATGQSHLEAAVPLSNIIGKYKNIRFVEDQMTDIDVPRRIIVGASGNRYEYHQAVLAIGVVTSYFGIPGLAEHSFGIKTLDEVLGFKDHLHQELTVNRHMDKHYVVVGAGATGVELSAALCGYLAEISKAHNVQHGKIKIELIEAAPRVLPRMSQRASRLVKNRLKALGVHVQTNSLVKAADADSIMVGSRDLESKTVVWTSGVTNHPFYKKHNLVFQLTKGDKVVVDEYLRAAPNTFVLGDNAATTYSGLAQTALHDAVYVSANLKRLRKKQALKTYKPKKPPVVIPVGPNWAIFEWGPLCFSGWVASFLRRAADFIGYHDVLPIGQALGVWRAENVREETCPECLAYASKN